MSITNKDVARKLEEIGIMMRLAGENDFRAIAFDRAARTIENLQQPITEYIDNRSLTDLKGIGKAISEDIYAYVDTGEIPVLEELKERVPKGLVQWLNISGLGPKNIAKIHQALDITTVEELREKCEDGSVAKLPGLGKKSAEKIIKSIEWMEQYSERCLLNEAMDVADPMFNYLKDLDGVKNISIAGSLRRRKETIGDIDILIGADLKDAPALFDAFTSHPKVTEILGKGETKSSVRTEEGRQVDVRIVKPEQFPAALMYFTGSKEHNVVMRQRARERGMALNEYGLFKLDEKGNTDFNQPVSYSSEADIFKKLGLHFIPPELREDMGEFEYFEVNDDAHLLELSDIRGVIHAHSTYSDGKYSIREMAEACMERGYEYLGISDHSKTAAYANGLSVKRLKQQWDEIEELNEEFKSKKKNFRILKGIESDILADGSLDYTDEILSQFDFVIVSVHFSLEMDHEKMMKRIKNAIANPYTCILGHPTGRLLLKREAGHMDMNEIVSYAAEHNVAIEINANPHRLDLDWRLGNKAREVGLISSINPDAHSIEGIDDIKYGVYIARKARFSKDMILNTKPVDELMKWFNERKEG